MSKDCIGRLFRICLSKSKVLTSFSLFLTEILGAASEWLLLFPTSFTKTRLPYLQIYSYLFTLQNKIFLKQFNTLSELITIIDKWWVRDKAIMRLFWRSLFIFKTYLSVMWRSLDCAWVTSTRFSLSTTMQVRKMLFFKETWKWRAVS